MWPDFGVELLRHLHQDVAERLDRDLALVPVQHLDEARHVRALEVVRQGHVHVEVRDGVLLAARAVLDAHRVVDVLDADLVDRDLARVGAALHVFDRGARGALRSGGQGRHGGAVRSMRNQGWRQYKQACRCRPADAAETSAMLPQRAAEPLRSRRARRHVPPARDRGLDRLRGRDRRAARQSSREPCSMKRSGMPRFSVGSGMAVRRQAFADRAAGAARDDVLLDSDERAMRGRDAQDQLFIERLDEAQVDERRIELLGDALAGRHHRADRDDRKPAATFASQLRLADRQRSHRRLRSRRPGPGRADSARPRVDRAARPCTASAGTRSRRPAP